MLNKKQKTVFGSFIFISALSIIFAGSAFATQSSVDNIIITVPNSCTLATSVVEDHYFSTTGGIYKDNIGTTNIKAICNDSNGFAIYAIGSSSNVDGNNKLVSSVNSNYDIVTGTNTSGDTSNWAMKITGVNGNFPLTIESGFNNTYTLVPSTWTKIASRASNTDVLVNQEAEGASFTTTYATYITSTQPAGIYQGKVKYVLIHPSTTQPKTIADLQYMQDFNRLEEGEKEIVKGSMILNQEYTLIDERDGKEYYIAKLTDGNVWMTQNLDHDITTVPDFYTSSSTDIPATSSPLTMSTATYTTNNTTWNSSYTTPESYDPGDKCWDGTLRNDYNGNPSNMTIPCTDPSANKHYSIGNYYNWTAAVAMNDSSNYTTRNQDVNQSICPAGWRLPSTTDATNGDPTKTYRNLVTSLNLASGTSGNIQSSPVYFVYGGERTGTSFYVGSDGKYWSSVVYDEHDTMGFYFNVNGDLYPQGDNIRLIGYSVRCVAR